MTAEEFDRSKIYEKLESLPEPVGYNSKIPWTIQQQIAATNGIHYVDSIGKLDKVPIPKNPLPKAITNKALCLDIGCGWGRWLVALGRKGYIPIGIDIRHEFCVTARKTLKTYDLNGYTVVADLKNLPFKDNVLDAVWSFSVIQHTHKDRLKSCIQHIHRILKFSSFCFLEFPNKYGVHNFFGPYPQAKTEADDYNSWAVRYYSIRAYRAFFNRHFNNFKVIVHSMLGIGVLSGDLKYAKGIKNHIQIGLSLVLTQIAKLIKPLVYVADSIYVICYKEKAETIDIETLSDIESFWKAHVKDPTNNLNIIPLLRCPQTGGSLRLEGDKLICDQAGIAYPILEQVPILVVSESQIYGY